MVQFLLKHDQNDRLRFASLQSDFAAKALARHGADAKDLDTVQVLENYGEPNEQLLGRSDAILRAGKELGGIWKALATLGKLVPKPLRNIFYRFVARNRYSIFGKFETCMLPEPRHRKKFLDM